MDAHSNRPPTHALSADAASPARITVAAVGDVDAIVQIEQAAYPLPWSKASFADVLMHQGTGCGDYVVQLLWSQQQSGINVLQGYFVAMLGYEEVHLLNLAVHPKFQGQGCARLLLQHLQNWARWYGARLLWLEVRQSNARAQTIYRSFGFEDVALRKNYYPMESGGREHAVVMQLAL